MRVHRTGITIWLSLMLMSGCAVIPQPFIESQVRSILEADRRRAIQGVSPFSGPVSLEEAVARALKYNLEHRTRMLQQALPSDQLEAGKFDMVPVLLASAGYASRNNDANRKSLNPETGSLSKWGYVSADRAHTTADIGLVRNVLDFGASYYRARQNAGQLLIASERRRKAIHTLIQAPVIVASKEDPYL